MKIGKNALSKLSFFYVAIAILGNTSVWAQEKFKDAEDLKQAELVEAKVENLSPTQARLGMQEVQRKIDKLEPLNREERHKYLEAHPIPVVVGPKGKLYIVDHHHLVRAIFELDKQKVFITVLDNFSDLGEKQFWKIMKARNLVYLKDDVENKTLTPDQLPAKIEDMKNDPFRSLAGMLRSRDGFIKTDKSFYIEFAWGRALRTAFVAESRKIKSWWKKSDVEWALKFALSERSNGLPGRVQRNTCRNAF